MHSPLTCPQIVDRSGCWLQGPWGRTLHLGAGFSDMHPHPPPVTSRYLCPRFCCVGIDQSKLVAAGDKCVMYGLRWYAWECACFTGSPNCGDPLMSLGSIDSIRIWPIFIRTPSLIPAGSQLPCCTLLATYRLLQFPLGLKAEHLRGQGSFP